MKRDEVVAIAMANAEAFEKQLKEMNEARPGAFKKKQIEDMVAGFCDGSRSMWQELVRLGHLKVED